MGKKAAMYQQEHVQEQRLEQAWAAPSCYVSLERKAKHQHAINSCFETCVQQSPSDLQSVRNQAMGKKVAWDQQVHV